MFLLIIAACSNNDNLLNEDDEDNATLPTPDKPYTIVDTGVTDFYSDVALISKPSTSNAFYGQDASYAGNQSSYTNNNNGTITDNITGLIWEQNMEEKININFILNRNKNFFKKKW